MKSEEVRTISNPTNRPAARDPLPDILVHSCDRAGISWLNTLAAMPGILACVAALSLLVGLLYFWHSQNFYTPDSPEYIAPASNFLAGKGFSDSQGYAATLVTPGYSLLIMPFVAAKLDLRYLIILQHLLRIAIALATTAFAFRLSGSRRRAAFVGLLLAADLPSLGSANTIMTETFFTGVFVFAVWLLWTESENSATSWTRSLLSGFLTGVAALIRPAALFFFFPAAIYLLLVRRNFRFRAALSFLLSFAFLPLLWTAGNEVRTGHFTYTSVAGINMLFYRAAGVLAIRDPGYFPANLEKRQKELQAEVCNEAKNLYPQGCIDFRVPQKERPEQSEYFMRLGRKIVSQHPFAYIRLVIRGAALMMLDGGAGELRVITGIDPHFGLRLLLLYTVPAFCLAAAGLLMLWKENRHFFYLAFLTVTYLAAVSSGAEAYSRFRVPMMPIYAILIGTGAAAVYQRLRKTIR